MFKQIINSTPLVTNTANNFFENIHGEPFQGQDVSFISTLRALVAPRMKEGEHLSLHFRQSNYTVEALRNVRASTAVRSVCGIEHYKTGTIVIQNFNSSNQDDNYAWLELMKSTFEKTYSGWHRLEKVTDFFHKTFYVLCFINPKAKSVIILADNIDIRKMHYLQCSIFAFLPWYFDPKGGVSELEMELIKALREKSAQAYKDCIDRIAEQYDFRTMKVKRLLTGFETKYERAECENISAEIKVFIDNINRLNSNIGQQLKGKNEAETRLLGLEAKIAADTGDSEIMDYFLRNNKLELEDVTDNIMIFGVKTYLEYFDEDLAKRVIDSNSSYIYRPRDRDCNNLIPAEDMKSLMYAIFVDQVFKIKFCSAYMFELRGNVKALKGYRYGSDYQKFMPNPHIHQYECLGNYSRSINELLGRCDYIGAIEQCIASCKSLNFADSPVMQEFMRVIYGLSDYESNNRCIELPNGSIVTPKDAITWMKSQEAKENE